MKQDPSLTQNDSTQSSTTQSPTLIRTMGLWALVIYGVGDMLGSGIYALIGKVAGKMGNAAWLAFVVSMVAALLTGLSYASVGSRYPRAAGVAYVAHRAFRIPFLSYLVGLAVIASGLTSFAVQSRAFSSYFLGMIGFAPTEISQTAQIAVVLSFIAALTFINFWGIRESTWLNIVCTFVEVSGLMIIIGIGISYWGTVNYLEIPPPADTTNGMGGITSTLLLQGAVLTFYSFVGFEDMINVTEEVKNPRKNFPIAVIVALAITTIIYIAVSISAVSVVPYGELNASGQPLVEVVKKAAPGFPSGLFSLIALFAITNTGLLNYIMGSRLVYGMARYGFVPKRLGAIHRVRRTPHNAIMFLMGVVIVLALSGDISQLASATSALLLVVFTIVNASLIMLKRQKSEPKGYFEVPYFVPAAAIVACAVMLFHAKPGALLTAMVLIAAITLLYFLNRPKNITEDALIETGM